MDNTQIWTLREKEFSMRDKEIVDANMIDQDQKRNRTNGTEGEEIKENMGEETNPI